MTKAVERILHYIEVCDMNITLPVAVAVVLAKSGEVINAQFSTLCDGVISDIVDTDPKFQIYPVLHFTIQL